MYLYPDYMQKYLTPVQGIFLRKLLLADADEVRNLIFSVLEEYNLHPEPGTTDADLYEVTRFYPDGRFWVMVDESDNIKGSAALYKIDSNTVELRKMYFHPSLRNQGLGRWLMSFVLHEAVKAGYKTVCLETATVLREARKLYTGFGFVEQPGDCHSARCDLKMSLDIATQNTEVIKHFPEVRWTDSGDEDFRELVCRLDQELAVRDGDEHAFYHQYNKIDQIKNALVLLVDGRPVACGAFKPYDDTTAEVKRMYVLPEHRQKGYAARVLCLLELWAARLGYGRCILETGKRQPEAIALYRKNNYQLIKNFGQYDGIDNSVCFEKIL